jgi:hypothetical protein
MRLVACWIRCGSRSNQTRIRDSFLSRCRQPSDLWETVYNLTPMLASDRVHLAGIRGLPTTCQLARCLVTEYKFRIGQLVYFHPKRTGRSQVDARSLDRIRSYSDYLLLRMANFTTRSGARSKLTIGSPERAN